jgi:hypothetical protein
MRHAHSLVNVIYCVTGVAATCDLKVWRGMTAYAPHQTRKFGSDSDPTVFG